MPMHFIKYLGVITILIFFNASSTFAQEEEEVDLFEITYDTPLTIDMEAQDEIITRAPKKKKVPKKTFYGIKTKRGWKVSSIKGKRVIEEFYYLKEPLEVDEYVRDIYWYHTKKRKVTVSSAARIDKNAGKVMHGPYKKTLIDKEEGDKIIEEGIYYKGTKHGRWSNWNKYDILISKEKYYKGWPKESRVQYYNKEKKQIREVIPVHFGEKEGNYFAFYESGNVAVQGEYQFDGKVGVWTEYYDQKRRKKRQVQHGKDPFDESVRPYIIKEWDKRGKEIYANARK
jgi:antitoxin component YwqK of YwqJK toxin-antitoxin module